MIRAIAAVDDCLGLATDAGIPWSVPADVEHFRTTTAGVDVLMGYATYVEFSQPMPGRVNYVATRRSAGLRDGFRAVPDAATFLAGGHPGDIWIIGGATLYAATLPMTSELHLTRVAGDYHCTKFFPAFEPMFRLTSAVALPSADKTPAIRFEIWTSL